MILYGAVRVAVCAGGVGDTEAEANVSVLHRIEFYTTAEGSQLSARHYAWVSIYVSIVDIISAFAEDAHLRNRSVVETSHYRAVLEEVGLMLCGTVHDVEFERSIIDVDSITQGDVRDVVVRNCLHHIDRPESAEHSAFSSPEEVVGEHISVHRHIVRALAYLSGEAVVAVICGVGSACAKLERSDVVPVF